MNAPLPSVHEAEAQRQHVRLRIPVNIVLDENYQTYDWSVGGFAIDTAEPFDKDDSPMDLTLQFKFRGFSMQLELQAELRHTSRLKDGTYRSGFQFINVMPDQAAALQYIVGANLSGELVHTSDVFAVINRDNTVAPRRKTPPPAQRSVAANFKRLLSVLFVLAVGGAVLWFILASMFERAYLTKAVSAVVAVDTVTARAPDNGALVLFAGSEGGSVEEGAALVGIERTDGRVVYLDSPCACDVLRVYVKEREFVSSGEPIAELVSGDATAQVRALFEPEAVANLDGVERVLVRRIGDPETYSGRVIDRRIDRSTGLVAMTIETGGTFTPNDADAPVSVTLNSAPFSF